MHFQMLHVMYIVLSLSVSSSCVTFTAKSEYRFSSSQATEHIGAEFRAAALREMVVCLGRKVDIQAYRILESFIVQNA
jgi:hypothetical protein